ncbi:hypothetical protein HDU98_008425 [Podochytrium sp. JEL0797]|nr:hypothetical protein HDU98_008425 [Podochytrium sp. JEL0797]
MSFAIHRTPSMEFVPKLWMSPGSHLIRDSQSEASISCFRIFKVGHVSINMAIDGLTCHRPRKEEPVRPMSLGCRPDILEYYKDGRYLKKRHHEFVLTGADLRVGDRSERYEVPYRIPVSAGVF